MASSARWPHGCRDPGPALGFGDWESPGFGTPKTFQGWVFRVYGRGPGESGQWDAERIPSINNLKTSIRAVRKSDRCGDPDITVDFILM